jgi:hypothetical protein
MTTRSYAELPDEYFEQYVETYRSLCSKTPRLWVTLFIGVFGQGAVLLSLFDVLTGHTLTWLVATVTFPPVFVYMALVFVRVPPPITPHTYRKLLLLVICWFSTNSVISVVATPVWSHATAGGTGTVVVVWMCILIGLTAILTVAKYFNKFRNQEIEYRDVTRREHGA